jgi:hypothetical protein
VCEVEEFLESPKNIVISFLESERLKIDTEFQVSFEKFIDDRYTYEELRVLLYFTLWIAFDYTGIICCATMDSL